MRSRRVPAALAVACLPVLTMLPAPASADDPVNARPTASGAFPRAGVSFAQGATQAQEEPAVRFEWEDHPTLVMGEVRIAFRARVQADLRRSDAPLDDEDEATTAALDVARKRIGVEGTLGDFAEFQVEQELDDADDPWRDVYLNYNQFEQAQFQFGKFKLPFGLEENVSSTNLDFVYRSLASRVLTPGRDRGYMVHGEVADESIGYELGVFRHDGSNAKSRSGNRVSGGETRALRLSARPFRALDDPADDFHLGIAWTWSDLEDEGLSSIHGPTTMSDRFFESEYPVLGKRKRFGFETRWRPGPVSMQAEFMRLTDERLGLSVEDTDLSPIRAVGWYVSGTWAVTGDSKADGLDETEHPIGRGGIGAIEVAGRLERLTFDSMTTSDDEPSTSPRADVIVGNSNRVLTFGVNWYLNRWIKVQFNLLRETIDDPEQGPLPDKPTFSGRVLRLQFSL